MNQQILIIVVLLILIIAAVVYAMNSETTVKTISYEVPVPVPTETIITETPVYTTNLYPSYPNLYPTGRRFRTYPQNIYPRIEEQTTFTISPSYFTGSDPNISAPTDRPQTLGVIYIASVDNSQWIWNGLIYVHVPQQGSSPYHILTTSDVISDGLTTMSVPELSIWVPSGLTTLRVKYLLRVSTSNTSYGSSISFPQASGLQVSGTTFQSNDAATSNALFSVDDTDGSNSAVSFPISDTAVKTMVAELDIHNSAGSTQDWFWSIDFVPFPTFASTPRTLEAGSSATYTLHY